MFFPKLRTCSIILLCMLSGTFAFGQVTTGGIVGSVSDPEGQSLPGINVTLSSPVMIEGKLVNQTDQDGYYRFSNLPPGQYKVEFTMQGFSTLIREGIRVQIGATLTIRA